MHITVDSTQSRANPQIPVAADDSEREAVYAQYKIFRRNGAFVGFEPSKIAIAMTKAFIAVDGGQGAASARVREQVAALTESVVNALIRRQPSGGTFHIEDIQDQVELAMSCATASTMSPAPMCSTAKSVPGSTANLLKDDVCHTG